MPGDLDGGAVHLGVHEAAAGSPRSRAELIGVVSMVQYPCPDRPHAPASYFWGMAVQPNRQCLGVGTAMLQQVLARAAASGASVVWADARLPAMPFYEQAGGVAVGEVVHDPIAGVLTRRLVFDLEPGSTSAGYSG